MPAISQSELTFQSAGKPIRLDAYLPATSDAPLPAVVALHGAGGNVSGMEQYASTLAAQGFAVFLLHYFDRTGTESADKPTILRNFPLWMKTLWDAISFVETQPQVDNKRIALLGFSPRSLSLARQLRHRPSRESRRRVLRRHAQRNAPLHETPLPRAHPARRGRPDYPRRRSLPIAKIAGEERYPLRNQNLSRSRPRLRGPDHLARRRSKEPTISTEVPGRVRNRIDLRNLRSSRGYGMPRPLS